MASFVRLIPTLGVVMLGLVGVNSVATGQDQSAATPKDAIFARKILMDTVSLHMDELETMTGSPKAINLDEGHEHADIVSVLLQLFPHIFPPSTNQWKAGATDRDPGTDTYASPDVWTNFSDFYKRTSEASTIAFKASRAAAEAEFRSQIGQLRQACDSCHAKYQKTE